MGSAINWCAPMSNGFVCHPGSDRVGNERPFQNPWLSFRRTVMG